MAANDLQAVQAALAEGDLDAAESLVAAALKRTPGDALLQAHMGGILMRRDRAGEAVGYYRRATELGPGVAELHNELGNALFRAGDAEGAEAALREALRLSPGRAEIHNNLGNALRASARADEAARCYLKALELSPDYVEALTNLGVVLQEGDDPAGAADCYVRAIAIDPEAAYALTHLGTLRAAEGRLAEAEDLHRRATASAPDFHGAWNNLGIVLKDEGRLAEAVAAYRMATQGNPDDPSIRSNLLMGRCYELDVTEQGLFEAHRRVGERWETGPETEFARDGDSDRVLKVGYVSPDLYSHSVASFIEPVIAAHDRDRIHVSCYTDLLRGDEVTMRLRAASDAWVETAALSDAALAERVKADGIDILVDLSGHTAGNRLPVFAGRAAPLQASWVGYPATTGLARMDYRITDAVVDPPGESDRWHSEDLLRLPSGFLCYRAPDDAPLPRDDGRRGAPVVGSFNNLSKVNERVIELWAAILTELSEARLLLKSRQLADAAVCDRIVAAFEARGIERARLDLQGRIASREAHLALYREVDVALDTFPYNGTTTTCEALWMGVPVVALAGDRHAARVGQDLLHRAGRDDWVGATPEDYVRIAVGLAQERPAPADIREGLRRSPLMDAEGFTRGLEEAYREIWRRRCGAAG